MKRLAPFLSGILLAAPWSLSAQTVLSDFSALAGQSPTFLDSWYHLPDPQYSQNAGYVSIVPVNGGAPQSDGRFQVGVTLDLTAFESLQIRFVFCVDINDFTVCDLYIRRPGLWICDKRNRLWCDGLSREIF